MGRNVRATRVYQTVKHNLSHGELAGRPNVAPAWLKAVEAVPPSEILTRPYALQHVNPNSKATKPRRLYQPTRIVYPEDKLRKEFYRDHPWELARPRIIMELDGEDYKYLDWSKGLRQRGMPLSGESVVQRQLYLMEAEGLSKDQAYDKARKEFYKLRHQEDVERRIAREEAQMYGAYFGKTALQVGMELEDKQFEDWKKWASEESLKMEMQRNQAYTSFGEDAAALEPEEEAAIV